MDVNKAKQKAENIPMPVGGEVITVPIMVALAFMKLHNLKKKRFDGGVLILEKINLPDEPVGDVKS